MNFQEEKSFVDVFITMCFLCFLTLWFIYNLPTKFSGDVFIADHPLSCSHDQTRYYLILQFIRSYMILRILRNNFSSFCSFSIKWHYQIFLLKYPCTISKYDTKKSLAFLYFFNFAMWSNSSFPKILANIWQAFSCVLRL